jgi:hypothetical protein
VGLPQGGPLLSRQDVLVSTPLSDLEPPAGRTLLPLLRREQVLRWRTDLLTTGFTAAVCVLLGAPLGLLWSAVAPHAHVAVDAAGATIVDGATEVFIAGDGWFIALTLLAGVATGVVAWLVARRSAPYVVVGLAIGGLLASYVASKVGVRLGQDTLQSAVHGGRAGTYVANVALQAKVAVVAWPIGALLTFATLVVSRADEIG